MKIRDKLIHFSEGTGDNLGKVTNKVLSLGEFFEMLRSPIETNETLSKYNRLPDKEQQRLKGLNGFFYRTQVDGKKRNRKSGRPSDLITLDLDYVSVEFFERLRNKEICSDFYWMLNTTRRHTPEEPRCRITIPLKTPLSNEDYPAVSRIIGQLFDPSMVHLDKVSFRPAQMMYKPTVSCDGEFLAIRNEAPLLNWEREVEDYSEEHGDWRDLDNWPRAAGDNLRVISEKAEDPTTKKGAVGAFCRAYSIEEAIEKFLPDVYEPVDGAWAKPRYTYLGGTTSNGAEVQDDGLFLYSHHGSDPCSEMLVNAFDLVRIHKFGKEDEGLDDEKVKALGPMKLPSTKALLEFLDDDKRFKKKLVESKYDMLAMFDDAGLEVDPDDDDHERESKPRVDMRAGEREATKKKLAKSSDYDPLWYLDYDVPVPGQRRQKPGKGWHTNLELDQNGEIVSNLPNITRILQNDPRFYECLEWNEFTQTVVTRVPLNTRSELTSIYYPRDPLMGDTISDQFLGSIRIVLESENGEGKVGWGLRVTDRDLKAAVDATAQQLPFHPVKDMLLAEEWDGKRRLATVGIRYLGLPDTAYHRQSFKFFMLAAVARTFEPGHKFDYCPILEGPQGIRKSSFLKALSGGFFGELTARLHEEKEVVENIKGALIMEIGELSAMRRSQIEEQKQFLTRTSSTIREAYARQPMVFKRQCVFAASTNAATYLQDLTGNRRFWPWVVAVSEIDIDGLLEELPQIWAEAFDIYVGMREKQTFGDLPLFLSPEATEELFEIQKGKMEETEAGFMASKITDHLLNPRAADRFAEKGEIGDTPDHLSDAQVWDDVLESPRSPSKMDLKHMGDAMRMLGWQKRHTARSPSGGYAKVWAPYQDGVSAKRADGSNRISGNEWRDHWTRKLKLDTRKNFDSDDSDAPEKGRKKKKSRSDRLI